MDKFLNIKFAGLLFIFLMFLAGCGKSKLQSNWWKLVAVNNPEQVQAYTDTLQMQEIRRSTPEAVKRGDAIQVKDSTWFHKSLPVDISQCKLSLGFSPLGILKVNSGEHIYEYKYDINWFKMTIELTQNLPVGEGIPVPLRTTFVYNRSRRICCGHWSTIFAYLDGSTYFSFHGRDTLILNNKYSNSLIFIKGDPIK
jgi:hypothetical protein